MTTLVAAFSTINLVPFTSSRLAAQFGMPLKPSVILLRWPVVILSAYLLLYPRAAYLSVLVYHTFILFYVASNVSLYFVGEDRFATWSFYYPLVVADTIVLTISLLVNGYADTNFYIAFFLIIITSCIIDDAKLRAVVSIVASAVYASLVLEAAESVHASVFLRIPFLFVVSLYYGCFTQFIRAEKVLRAEMEQRGEAQKEILDVLSHELRTPLNVIGGYVESLKNGIWGAVNPEQSKALEVVRAQSANLITLVESLVDLTRLESSQLPVKQEEISMGDFFRELRLKYEYALEKPVTLCWSIPENLPNITTDKVKLIVIFQNLINNAIKFTSEGEIRIAASRSPSGRTLKFQVADSGTGIPSEKLPHIFEKFYQVDRTSTRALDGLGLGLYIVKVFTDVLGGKITVDSHFNRGSTFTLSLPV